MSFAYPLKLYQVPNKTIFQSTIESDNKRRPILLRKTSKKYDPPLPETPDPNSGNMLA